MEEFKILFDFNPNPMWVYDLNTLEFVEVNDTAVKLYGYSRGEFLKMKITDIRSPEEAERLLREIKEKRPDFKQAGEWKHHLKNGRVIDVEITSHTVSFLGRECAVVAAKDITGRKKAEKELRESSEKLKEALEELRQAQDQIIHQERLRALGSMASGIAHDFNNALSPILGYSDFILSNPKKLEDKEKVKRAFEVIKISAQDAGKIVSRLREFYRRQESREEFKSVSLNEIVKEAVGLTEIRWKGQALVEGKTIKLETSLGEIPEISGSPVELRELLVNLIFNAIDAMPEGGTIFILTKQQNEKILLEIKDTGEGMPDEVKLHCFEPFFTTKGEKGSGLGLSMVTGIVKHHSGAIDVKSEVGKGTIFSIQFPVILDKKADTRSKGEIKIKGELSFNILLVDDEPQILLLLEEFLTSVGHRVVTAQNGAEALEKFNSETFDLMIVDKAMPGISGEKLIERIKKGNSEVSIILLSGSFDVINGDKPLGVDLTLVKPVTQNDLLDAVQKVMSPAYSRRDW